MVENEWISMRVKFITGFGRYVFDGYLSGYIFLKYTVLFLSGRISSRQYVIFFKRLLLFYARLRHNKVVKIGNVYKMHLYLPSFPTPAFFKAVDKFLLLDQDPPPTSVLLSMTKACAYNCSHCYQKHDRGNDLPLEKLIDVAAQIQDAGISLINIEGGEPLLKFDRLLKLVESIDNRAEVWVNTNGYGLTEQKAKKLRDAGVFGVMISLHHWDRGALDEFVREEGAFDTAISALRIFAENGISTVINCCATRDLIDGDGFEKIMDLAKDYGCSLVQLIHGKSAGGWLGREDPMGKRALKKLQDYHLLYNESSRYKNYPSVSSQAFESLKENFGCTAGGIERFYVNAHGEVQPCEFLNVSVGNIQEESFLTLFKRMRALFRKSATKWLCCTECEEIERLIREGYTSTPLPKEKAIPLMRNWDRGEETPLYEKMKLYANE
jgi:MoaA/NifB/PqqE/SkfB family radical SAM enzyme